MEKVKEITLLDILKEKMENGEDCMFAVDERLNNLRKCDACGCCLCTFDRDEFCDNCNMC